MYCLGEPSDFSMILCTGSQTWTTTCFTNVFLKNIDLIKIVTFRFSINYTFFSDKSESGGILYSPSLDLHFFMHFCSGRCGSVMYVYAYSLQGLSSAQLYILLFIRFIQDKKEEFSQQGKQIRLQEGLKINHRNVLLTGLNLKLKWVM